jgi:hypothetical protein
MTLIQQLGDHSLGERKKRALRVDFDRTLKVEFHGTIVIPIKSWTLYNGLHRLK